MPGYGVAPAEAGEGLLPWSWAEERLTRSHAYWLSTTRPDGRPHAMPVWAVWLDGALFFSTGGKSRKTRNLAHRSECVITTELAEEAVIVEGTASLVPTAAPRVEAAYRKKYGMGYPADSHLYRVAPSQAFAFIVDGTRFTATATRWRW